MTSASPGSAADAARELLSERYGDGDGVRVASAPGRVNLIGGHTDYNDGFVLPVAIDRRTAVAVRPREDDRIRVYTDAFDAEADVRPDGADTDAPRWTEYVRGVVLELTEAGLRLPGADVAVVSDVPIGAGLASSAALETATAAAFRALADGRLADRSLARACWRAETDAVGVDCGIMDQFAAVFGRADAAVFLDCRTEAHRPIHLPEDVALVVIDTTVGRDLASAEYDERRAACRRAAARLDEAIGGVDALRDVSTPTLSTHRAALPPELRPIARHVVEENERVLAAAIALEDGDLGTLGGLMTRSHASLRDQYDVSSPELDAAVDIALDHPGVLGARLTGAGFGGAAVALVRPGAVDGLDAAIGREFPDRTGTEATVYRCLPAEGVRLGR